MTNWRKSTYSYSNGACVEIGHWRKSTHSLANTHCVEISGTTEIAIRDTQLGESSPIIAVSRDTWTKFLRSVA